MASGGAFSTRQTYYPYGAERVHEGSALPTDYTFTGQKNDATTGLMFYGARYYDTTLGRFTQADTMVPGAGNSQAFNRYAYGLNNPVTYTDPSGHSAEEPACQSWDSWCWENRYWTAQGKCYSDNSGGWTRECAPTITDPEMLAQVAGENPDILSRPDTQVTVGLSEVVAFILDRMLQNAQSTFAEQIQRNLSCANSMQDCLAQIEMAYSAWGAINLPGAAWDYKQSIRGAFGRSQHVGLFSFSYDVWTNIHFGYVGSSIGFSPNDLLNGAGVAQKIAGTSNSGWGLPPSTWDDPSDQTAITIGITLWLDHGLSVQVSDIVEAVQWAAGLNRWPDIAGP